MGAGAIAAREGAYTTWVIQGIYDLDFAWSPGNDVLTPRNDGNVLYSSIVVKETYIISPAGALLETLTEEKAIFDGRSRSLADRYMIMRGKDNNDVIVQEGIGERWRRDIRLDRGAYNLEANPIVLQKISPSGEWVVVLVNEATTGNNLIFIYKGSP